MPKKPRPANPNGLVAAYCRKSQVIFPDGCDSPAQRQAFVDDLRRIRVRELESDALSDNETITAWYDDMGVSGRGEFLEKRTSFLQMRQDARAGLIRLIYARDLSRLFRDHIQQELFFQEMEEAGVVVRSQDLPRINNSAGVMVRRMLGVIHQHKADLDGETIRRVQEQKVLAGQWVGRTKSLFGLRYSKATKGYEYDPEGAEKINTLFALFIARAGNAKGVAEDLNQRLKGADPTAFLTPTGRYWYSDTILNMIRNSVWRREVSFGEHVVPNPDLIPEVVPLDIVLQAQALAAARTSNSAGRAINTGRAISGSRRDYTYSGLALCALCGSPVRAVRTTKAGSAPARLLPARIFYRCSQLHQSRTLCPESFGVGLPRLDDLVGRAVQEALRVVRLPARGIVKKRRKKVPDPPGRETQLRDLDAERARYLKEFEDGECTWEEYKAGNRRVDARRAALEAAWEQSRIEGEPEPPASLPQLTEEQWQRLVDQAAALWPGDIDVALIPRDDAKAALLLALGARITLRVLYSKTQRSQKIRPGRLEIVLELATLGLVGDKAITALESAQTFSKLGRHCNAPSLRGGDIIRDASGRFTPESHEKQPEPLEPEPDADDPDS